MKVVTVGTSQITSTNITQMRMAGIEIYACVSRDLERAQKFAEKNNVERYADNYDKVLKSNEFDFVYIGLPNSLHYAYAKKALENDKNVICEKPICLNQKQTKELIALALSKHLYIFENMKAYHSLAYKKLREDLDKIKPVRLVNLNFTKYSSKYDRFKVDLPQTAFSLEYGSGALMDLNCYNVSFAVGLFGLPLNVLYLCNKISDVDVSGTAVLKYKDFMVNCIAGKDSSSKSFIDICGERGHIYSECTPSQMDEYKICLNNGDVQEVSLKEPNHFVSMFRDFKNIYENNDTYKYDYYMKLSLMEMKVLDDLKNFGIRGQEEVDFVGGNAKMNEFQAAMGICNLRHYEDELKKREKVYNHYMSRLENKDGIKLNVIQSDVTTNYAYFPVVFDGYKYTRNEVFGILKENNIIARKYFYPLTNGYECYRNYPTAGVEKTPVAQHISLRVLTLPIYADLDESDVDRICDIILD